LELTQRIGILLFQLGLDLLHFFSHDEIDLLDGLTVDD
jgi:hypothetical protein